MFLLSAQLIPARGLKLEYDTQGPIALQAFRSTNPRKGTETNGLPRSALM